MYKLIRISAMNWNLIDVEDIDIKDTTAIIGRVGVGKSTLLDLVQTVLSGNQKRDLRLNRAAGSIKSTRTVQEYCLGVTEETKALGEVRNVCDSIIAMTFEHAKLKHQVSIGLWLHADDEMPREITKMRFVAAGAGFSFNELADRDEHGQMIVASPEVLLDRLKEKSGKGWETFNNKAGAYVDHYLRTMRIKGAAPNATQYLKRLRNAIAFEEIANPTDFIRNFVLEEKPIETDALKENLQTWEEISAKIQEVEDKIKEVRKIQGAYVRYGEFVQNIQGNDFRQTWHGIQKENAIVKELSAEAGQKKRRLEHLKSEKDRIRAEIRTDGEILSRKEAFVASSGVSESREATTREIKALEKEVGTCADLILSSFRKALDLKGTERLDRYLPAKVKIARKEVETIEAIRDNIRKTGNIGVPVDTLLEALATIKSVGNHIDALDANRDTEAHKLRDDEAKKGDLDRQLRNRHGTGPILDPQVQDYLNDLVNQEIVGQALPSIVEITPGMEDWVRAAESVLGPYRQAVFVDPKDFDEAFRIMRGGRRFGKQYYDRVRLIKSEKIASGFKMRPAKEGSIAAVLRTENEIVRKFLDDMLGSIIMVDDEKDLKNYENGVAKTGARSERLTVRVSKMQDPILGLAAQTAMIQALQMESHQLAREITVRTDLVRDMRSGISALSSAASIDVDEVSRAIHSLNSAKSQIESLKERREADEPPEVAAVMREIDSIKEGIQSLRNMVEEDIPEEVESISLELGEVNKELTNKKTELRILKEKSEEMLQADFGEPYETFRKAFRDIEHAGRGHRLSSIKEQLERQNPEDPDWHEERIVALKDQRKEFGRAERFSNLLRGGEINPYLNKYQEDIKVGSQDPEQILRWLIARFFTLQDNELRQYQGEVEERKAEVRNEVREILVLKLNDSFVGAQTELRKLNKRLAKHKFEGLTYFFNRSVDPAMLPLYQMCQQVAADPTRANELLSQGGNAQLDEAVEIIRDIFTNEGTEAKFVDYRQYFRYELNMTADEVDEYTIDSMDDTNEGKSNVKILGSLSERSAKGSGGQKQTPYYVAIAASMAAVYFPNARPGDNEGMGLVCFDEAFSKLDIKNTQQLIRFFQDLGLQILVAAPEEKRTSFMELMDTIINISKEPGKTELYIDPEYPKQKLREELMAANPERLGIEGYRARLAEGEGKVSTDLAEVSNA